MKKVILFLSLVLCAQISFAQSRNMKSLWDLDYGMSKAAVEKKMKKERDLWPQSVPDNGSTLFYSGCKYFGENSELVFFNFAGDFLYKSTVVIQPSPASSLFSVYDKLKKELTRLYGTPPHSESEFEFPYRKGDGRELEAVRKDKTDFFSMWDLPADNPVNNVGILISSPATIYIYYTNLDMRDKADVLKSLAEQY